MHSIRALLFWLIINLTNLTVANTEKSLSFDTSEKSSKSLSKATNCAPVIQEVPGYEPIFWDVKLKDVNYYLSTPTCLDEKFHFKARKCIENTFEPEFPCENIQKPVSKCPEPSEEIEVDSQTVCYDLTAPIKYSELECKYKNAASMSKFVNYMAKFTDKEVWYPGSKYGPYKIFLHDEITENYRSPVEGVEYEDTLTEGKNCIKINSFGKKIAVSCDEQYAGLCIFKILADVQDYSYCRLANGDKHYINHYDLNQARCLVKIDSSSCNSVSGDLAEYLESFQSYAITYETNERYQSALTYRWSTPIGFYWSTTDALLTYGWWSTEVQPDKTDIYSIAKGWTAMNSFGGTVVYVCQAKQTITFQHTHIEFNRNTNTMSIRLKRDHLQIARIGSEPVFCFTDRDKGSPVTKINLGNPTSESEEIVYQFTITDNGYPGKYWCEGFILPDFSQPWDMKIEHKIEASNSDNYVVLVAVKFNEGEDPLGPTPVPKRTVELFETALGSFYFAVNVKWAGVDNVDKVASRVTYILHIWPTASGQGQTDERLEKLQEFIEDNIEVEWTSDVFSSYYCRTYKKSPTNLYHWEKTIPGGTHKVFCNDGLKSISRVCIKDDDNDFVQGVRWASVEEICPEDCLNQKQIVNGEEISWDTPISTTAEGVLFISTPICLDEGFGYVTRLKKDNCFHESPECHSLQDEHFEKKSSLCPPFFDLYDTIATKLCYSFTTEVSPYPPPQCPYSNNLSPAEITDEVIQILLTEVPIWYPAKRNDKYGYTYFLHDEYSKVYRKPIDMKYKIDYDDGVIANKKCLILKRSSGEISLKAVKCEQQYTYICIYKPLQEEINSYCQLMQNDEKCYQSQFDLAKSKCICPKTASESCTLAEFLHEYQTYKVSDVDTAYKIGLAYNNEKTKYSWADSKTDLIYSRWSKDLDPNTDVYISHNGWVQKGYSSDWLLCQFEFTFNKPSLKLNLDFEADKFTVILTNPKDIARNRGDIFCFTDTGAYEVVSEITDLEEIESMSIEEEAYVFDKPNLAGYFWCEVFAYPQFENIESSYFVDFYNHYVFCLTVKFEDDEDPTSPVFVQTNIIDKLQGIFTDTALDFVTVTWSMTLRIGDVEKEATYCLNLKTDKTIDYNEEELKEFDAVLEQKAPGVLENQLVALTELLSSYYCRSIEIDASNEYFWPSTNIGDSARVSCSTEGVFLTRLCNGDFTKGGQWGIIEGDCPIEDYECEPLKGIRNSNIDWDTKISNSKGDPSTNYYISTPICLDEFYAPLVRICENKVFQDEPTCIKIQPREQPSFCPNDLEEYKIDELSFCILITGEIDYPPKCPYKNTVPFTMQTTEVLKNLNLNHPVWYPAARNKIFGISYFMNMELSSRYMNFVDVDFAYLVDRDCAIITPEGIIEAVRCTDSMHKALCVYLPLDKNLLSYCALKYGDHCYNSNFELEQIQCYCLQNNIKSCTIAEVLLPFQNRIIPIAADITYQIKVCPQPWYSKKTCEYSFWSKNLMFVGDNNYLGIDGWQQLPENEEDVKHICEKDASLKGTPTLELTKSDIDTTFYVKVTNPSNIVVQKDYTSVICFTDAVSNDLLLKFVPKLIQQTETEYKYEFTSHIKESTGHFWCEAFTYPDFEMISSSKHFLVKNFNNYPFYVELMDYGRDGNPLTKEFVNNFILKVIQNEFEAAGMRNIEVRWMQTDSINEIDRTVKYLLHLTTRTVDDDEDELKLLSGVLEAMSKSDTNMITEGGEVFSEENKLYIFELTSSSYCKTLNVDENGDHWELTSIDNEAIFKCLYEDFEIKRKCNGDFMTGGIWGEIEGVCPKPEDFECDPLPGEINLEVTWKIKISQESNDIRTNYYISTPICLDEFLSPKTRICKEKVFQQEPTCEHIQEDIKRCPEDLTEKKIGELYFCYNITNEKSTYPPNCPYKNTIPFAEEATRSLMSQVLDERVWYPARRYLGFEFSYLMINEPSADYMSDIRATYSDEQISDKDCAIRDIDGTIKAANCDSQYKGFCAYFALENNQFSSCNLKYDKDMCYDTNFDLNLQTSCHCKEKFKSVGCNIAEMHFPYQNFIIPSKSDIVYKIALCEKGWCSRKPLEYSYWSINIKLEAPNRYLSWNGWQTKPEHDENVHYLCEKRISYGSSSVRFAETGQNFRVILNAQHGIVHRSNFDVACFTDAVPYDLLLKLDLQFQQIFVEATEYSFTNPFPKISGNYWCEVFSYPNVELITTKKVFYDSGYNNYVTKISTRYKNLDSPLSKDFVEQNVIKPLQTKLKRISILYLTVRWMKTIHVNDNKREITYLIHLSTQTTTNNEEELSSLQELIKIAVEEIPNLKVEGSILSSSYCPSVGDLWHQTECGKTVFASKPCLEADGRLVRRKCGGDFTNGCQWEKPTGTCKFQNADDSLLTCELYDLLIGNLSNHETIKELISLTARKDEFNMIDVFLTAVLFEQILPDYITTSETSKIIHNVMNVHPITLRQSQLSLNSTDKILYHFDYILLDKKPDQRNTEELLTEGDVNILLLDAKNSEVNGISIVVKNQVLVYQYLYKNLTDLNTINEKDLILATHIPEGLIEQIISESGDSSFTIRLTIFLKDTMFHEEVGEKRINGGKNLGILLPEIKTMFKFSIPVILRPMYEIEEERGQCGFWKYGTYNNHPIQGSWSKLSQMQILQDNIRCEFSHTTHFAFLVMGSQSDFEKNILENSYFLLIITTIECVLSLLGIVGIFITAILFKTWRRNKGNQILLHLSIVTFVQFGLLYISGAIKENQLIDDNWCFAIGIALHYSVLAQFCWMLVIAYLQYKRFVQVFKRIQSGIVLKSCVVGYLLPILPVLYLLLQQRDSYLDKNAGICYPSGDGLTYGVLLPIGCVILINILLFVCIIINIFFPKSKSNGFDDDLLMLRFRLVIILFFMLGMTWIFGILGQMTRNIMFLFLFSLTASLQGFILFMFFIVFNKRSRKLYIHYFKIKRYGA